MKDFDYKIYNFIEWRHTIFLISGFLMFVFCIIVIIKGFNLGLDLTGGMLIEITTAGDVDMTSIKNAFVRSGFIKVIVQRLGVFQDFIIRLPLIKSDDAIHLANVRTNILNILNNSMTQKFIITQINWVGPTVSSDLIKTGMMALLAAAICIVIYITFRFEWRVAIGTIISVTHDIIVIIGILSLFSIEIDSTIIAALMSSIGYSLNDKIVIFDRIRENFYRIPDVNSMYIFNISLHQVLHRTIITSVTTVLVLLILLIFGGSILHGFSMILLIGVIIGTISSICIASVLVFEFGIKHENFITEINHM